MVGKAAALNPWFYLLLIVGFSFLGAEVYAESRAACQIIWQERTTAHTERIGPLWLDNQERAVWNSQRNAFFVEVDGGLRVFGERHGKWQTLGILRVELFWPVRVSGESEIARDFIWHANGDSIVGVLTRESGWTISQVALAGEHEVRRLHIPVPNGKQLHAENIRDEQLRYESNLQWMRPTHHDAKTSSDYLMVKTFLTGAQGRVGSLLNREKKGVGIVLMIEMRDLRFDAAIGANNDPLWDVKAVYQSRAEPNRVIAIFAHPQFDNREIEVWDLPQSQRIMADRNLRPEYVEALEKDGIPIWNQERMGRSEPRIKDGKPLLIEPSPQHNYFIKKTPVPGRGSQIGWAIDLIRMIRETKNEDRPYRQVLLASVPIEFLEEGLGYYWLRNGDTLLIREREGRVVVWDQARHELSLGSSEHIMHHDNQLLLMNKVTGSHQEIMIYGLYPWAYHGRLRVEAHEHVLGLTDRGDVLTVSVDPLKPGEEPIFTEHKVTRLKSEP